MDQSTLLGLIMVVSFAIFAIVVVSKYRYKGNFRRTGRRYYVDTDLRLTYRQYMKLHPDSPFSYVEFKRAQSQRAYTKSGSSKELKRMVR